MDVGVKFGLTSGAEMADIAAHAEALGYDWAWVSERVAIPLDQQHPYEPSIDPWIALGYLAAATKRMRLGTVVSQIALRDPVLMARELITLDILSHGRMVVGAGAGWVQAEFDATNVPFETRGGRLNEFIRALRQLFTEPEKGWEGKFFHIPPVGIVKPQTPGGPPIWIGAANEAGLRRTARYGDGYLGGSLPLDALKTARQRVMELREGYGRQGPFAVFAQVEPPESADAAREIAEKYREAGIDGIILSERLAREPGLPSDEISEVLLSVAHD